MQPSKLKKTAFFLIIYPLLPVLTPLLRESYRPNTKIFKEKELLHKDKKELKLKKNVSALYK